MLQFKKIIRHTQYLKPGSAPYCKWDKLPVPQFLNLSGKDNTRTVKIKQEMIG